MILTLDLGTHRVKAALWEPDGLVDLADVALTTDTPEPGASEQDPDQWWGATVAACRALAARGPDRFATVDVVACTGARQTFGLFDAAGTAIGPGIVWSDTRATGTGRSATVADRLGWVATHRADHFDRSAWIVGPRDRVVWQLTGSVATDPTMASLTGCYGPDGAVDGTLPPPIARRLPTVVPSGRVTGAVTGVAAGELGLPAGVPVVIGAGDRQCEALGTGANGEQPMVSWGTTANVSLPVDDASSPPAGVLPSRSADGGWLLEGGVSAAGSLLSWLGGLCGRSTTELTGLAAGSPPGARGVIAVPWLGGARAPWWRPGAGAGFVGIDARHGPGDLARAVFEAVARDLARCLAQMAGRRPPGPEVCSLWLTGGGATAPVWIDVLTGITGLPGRLRRSGQGASVGAALLGARALGHEWDLDILDPVVGEYPVGRGAEMYAREADHADRVATSLIDLAIPPGCA